MSGNGEVRPTKGSMEGPWNKDRAFSARNVRPPKVIPDLSNHSINSDGAESSNRGSDIRPLDPAEEVLRTSKLNANAQEFVPQWSQPQIPQTPSPEDMSYLVEAIDVLTMSPGRYQEFLPPIEDIVESVLHDAKALEQIIDVSIEQCIVEANFRYTGARMCRDLAAKFGLNFINTLLSRCSERFSQLPALILEDDRRRVSGFGLLLAELYLQITVDETTHIRNLSQGLLQILNMLLASPADDTIRTVVQILKLTGVTLQGDGVCLERIFTVLEELAEAPSVDENVRRIIANLLHLRRTEWCFPTPEAPTIAAPVGDGYSEPVFYSPDGQVMSEEERSFLFENIPMSDDLDDYIVDNDMDDEVSAAFDEFVTFSQNNHPGYRS